MRGKGKAGHGVVVLVAPQLPIVRVAQAAKLRWLQMLRSKKSWLTPVGTRNEMYDKERRVEETKVECVERNEGPKG